MHLYNTTYDNTLWVPLFLAVICIALIKNNSNNNNALHHYQNTGEKSIKLTSLQRQSPSFLRRMAIAQ